jgi:flagellar biosynthesis protein FlhB
LADAVLSLTMPILVATALTSCALQIVQTGGVVASGVMAPKLERLDWTSGVKRLCSAARLFVLPRALVGGMAVAWIAMGALVHRLPDLARTAGRAPAVGSIVADMVGALGWRVCFVALGLALVDIVVSRRAWRRRLRMTRDEVKREQRESEGDPQSKEARQRAHGEMLTQTIPTRVRNASVVVVDPAHHACALRYDEIEGDRAPVVVARGEGELADRIVRSAHEFGVSVVTDAWLARALLDLDVGAIIPETLFDAVAALLREIRSASESAVVLSPPAAPVRPR